MFGQINIWMWYNIHYPFHAGSTQGDNALTLMLLVAKFAYSKKGGKMTETLAYWYMNLRVLSESYPMNTNMAGFKCFSKIFAPLCFEQKQPQHWKD